MSRVSAFVAMSLDGFISGPNHDLSWLPQPEEGQSESHGFTEFFGRVGSLLMGRTTYDVVSGMGVPWPYGDKPVLVATRRGLESQQPTVKSLEGQIGELLAAAKKVAGAQDVYVDGGQLIRQALDADALDELIITIVPTVLGHGTPLFADLEHPHRLTLAGDRVLAGGMVQLTYRPVPRRD